MEDDCACETVTLTPNVFDKGDCVPLVVLETDCVGPSESENVVVALEEPDSELPNVIVGERTPEAVGIIVRVSVTGIDKVLVFDTDFVSENEISFVTLCVPKVKDVDKLAVSVSKNVRESVNDDVSDNVAVCVDVKVKLDVSEGVKTCVIVIVFVFERV